MRRSTIITEFKKLGLSEDQADIYLELWLNGAKTIVQLSKHLNLGRNVIYRIIDELSQLNLINVSKSGSGSTYEAMHYDNLKYLVDKKEEKLYTAKSGLEQIFKQLPTFETKSKVSSNVIHYYGVDGLKQVNWNMIKAKDMFRIYEVSRLSSYLGSEFADSLRTEWVKRGTRTRDLTNDKVLKPYSNVAEYVNSLSEHRYISPKILKIETEVFIYNDTVAILQYDSMKYKPESIFCVEIHNQELAKFQTQVFDILWEQAQLMKKTDDMGGREILNTKEN